MSLVLYSHPLASFCHKALIALYENHTPFEPVLVDFGDAASAAAFRAVWPMAKMPALRDEARQATVAEATIVIEYLDSFYPGPVRFLSENPDAAWRARMWDRFYDHYLQEPMQKIVTDRLRPESGHDPVGVEQAKAQLAEAYDFAEKEMAGKRWAIDDTFGLVECAAAPALFYANAVVPFEETHPNLTAYLDRLMLRPSFARVLVEAGPYFVFFPMEKKPRLTPLGVPQP